MNLVSFGPVDFLLWFAVGVGLLVVCAATFVIVVMMRNYGVGHDCEIALGLVFGLALLVVLVGIVAFVNGGWSLERALGIMVLALASVVGLIGMRSITPVRVIGCLAFSIPLAILGFHLCL